MEFFIVALIFIACMIALALLIYYCQEYRQNRKYSFTKKQRDISALALAIGAPTFNESQLPGYKSAGIVPFSFTSGPPPPSLSQSSTPECVIKGTKTEKLNVSPHPIKPSLPILKGPLHAVEDEMSDSDSSTSSKIYFSPKTAAYSIAKRISISANAEALAKRRSLQSVITAHTAAYIFAKKMKEAQQNLENPKNNLNDGPSSSENTNKNERGSSLEPYSIDMRNNRSASPYIPVSVLTFQDFRSRSPFTSLNNNGATCFAENERIQFINSKNNSFPKQGNMHLEQKEMAPPERSENIRYPKESSSFINREDPVHLISPEVSYRSHSPVPLHRIGWVLEQKEMAPPQRSENICYPKESSSFINREDHLHLVSPEISYRSHSPVPLHRIGWVLEQKEMAPPQRGENVCYPKESSSFINREDHLHLVSPEISYRSHSPVPLRIVEEEE